ncbi:trypsin-like serine protease [Flammeovirga sp. MY04]|uniref:S1 family peptidase n=1 Tax=Flammeovirga sp. MY04 TaxID=1191459 RepID=UPI0008063CF5|nr:trypsin-like serine protease [Flammeovirga sp. MY04]ANQ51696.1 trypsin-like serine protease [Flammeovirga sp. MY04]
MKLKHLLFFGLSFFVFISCDDNETNDPDPVEENTFGIRHDKELSEYESLAATVSPENPDFRTVVQFKYSLDGTDEYDYTASGVVIDEEWILTAGHNFYDKSEQSNPAPVSGITIRVGNDPNNPDTTYTVESIYIHPTWLNWDQNYSDANDLCLVKVSSAIADITPAQLFTDKTETLGNKVWICGFGDYSKLEGQDKTMDSKKHAMENVLDRLQEGLETSVNGVTYSGGLVAFDFDNPGKTINSLGDDIVNADEKILGEGTSDPEPMEYEATTVSGDSGGPLFLKDTDGAWKVSGILGGGASNVFEGHVDGSYGDISIYTRVSTSYDWISSVMNDEE